MSSNSKNKLTPQISEGISKVMWVKKSEISSNLDKSFDNLKDLINKI